MKNRIISLIMAMVLILTSGILLYPTEIQATGAENELPAQTVGTTYYVSSINGDNSNSGKSKDQAWQTLDKINALTLKAGDRVLLERGSIFANQYLHPKGSGVEGAPIIISAYGQGEKPEIQANGEGIWYQDYGRALDNPNHKFRGYASSSVLLYDMEYVEMSHISITNREPNIDSSKSYSHRMDRTGVAVVAQNKGTLDHIYLDNLTVKDVDGNVYNKHMNNGGIYFTALYPEDEATTGISRYNDVRITNNYLDNVRRWGIAMAYSAYHAQFNDAVIPDSVIQKYGATNVVVENNFVQNIGGDGITLMYVDRPIVQYNISDKSNKDINSPLFSEMRMHKVAAGIWPWKTKNAIFQYNEAYDTVYNQDSQAWDADYGDGTIYQYNYSHNNAGGSIMFCGIDSINNIFRYNISYEDLSGLNPAGNNDAHVYNNTFIMKEGVDIIRTNMSGGGMLLENNIFYYNGSTPKQEDWYKGSNTAKFGYNNNLYYNYANIPAEDKNAIQADPKFLGDLSTAPRTYSANMKSLDFHSTKESPETSFDMFKIANDSPAVNKGILFTSYGADSKIGERLRTSYRVKYNVNWPVTHATEDFYGNPIGSQPDLGAHETDATENVVLTLRSDYYTISGSLINDVLRGTTVGQLKEKLIFPQAAKLTVERDLQELTDTQIIQEGDKVKLSYLDQSVEYSIAIKKIFVEYDYSTMTATAGNERTIEPNPGYASYAIDGNPNTIWHTDWNGTARENMWLTLDLGSVKKVAMYKYVPRSSQINGIITKYKIEVSDDNQTWTEVASGVWESNNSAKIVEFNEVQARYVKLTAVESATDQATQFASAAELRVGYEKVEGGQ